MPARELALLWAPAAAHGQQGCALAPSSLSLVPMTSSSQPEPTAGASSLRILFWDSDVYSFLRISQVAQTEWLPVSPKSPGIWPQTKFAWGQYSASPQPRWQSEGEDSERSALAQGTVYRLAFQCLTSLKTPEQTLHSSCGRVAGNPRGFPEHAEARLSLHSCV